MCTKPILANFFVTNSITCYQQDITTNEKLFVSMFIQRTFLDVSVYNDQVNISQKCYDIHHDSKHLIVDKTTKATYTKCIKLYVPHSLQHCGT
jgi:hypothetical protein